MIEVRKHGRVLEIAIANPPVNALAAEVRRKVADAITALQGDETADAAVITGRGKLFSGGADITEFDGPPADPSLPWLVNAVEASAKPVVAVIHGVCFGGGLELALACHYRVAAPSARLGMPEIKLGLLPGAGGTQRLPRLIGVAPALDMILSGDPVAAEQALASGLIDRVFGEGTLADEALAFAADVAGAAPRRSGEIEVAKGDHAALFEAGRARFAGRDAPHACIDAVAAATRVPVAEGMALEAQLFEQLSAGTQSRALRHLFFAERQAARIVGLPKDTPARPIGRVGIIGAGTMGGGIAMNFLSAGLPVTIVETAEAALERGVATIRGNYEASAAKGRLTPGQVEQAMALLTPTLAFDLLADCDLVIEAVYEEMAVKREIFSRLDAVAKPGAILASNTSFLDIDSIAAVTGRPADVLGLHFFSPANVMKLLEVVRGKATADDVLATAMALARRIGKVPVVSGVCHGFIGNRMLVPRQDNAIALVIEGASPEQVDKVHTDYGMPMGPFQMSDLAGVDIGWHRDPQRIESLPDALCAAGRWGQKAKAGYYDYDDRRKATPSPVTQGIVERYRAAQGVTPREVGDEEIVARTLYTMVNEAAKILEEGIAQRPSDIDVVYAFGYGWPRHRGGPVFWADEVGGAEIVGALERHHDRLGPDFSLSRLLRRKAAAGAPLLDPEA